MGARHRAAETARRVQEMARINPNPGISTVESPGHMWVFIDDSRVSQLMREMLYGLYRRPPVLHNGGKPRV